MKNPYNPPLTIETHKHDHFLSIGTPSTIFSMDTPKRRHHKPTHRSGDDFSERNTNRRDEHFYPSTSPTDIHEEDDEYDYLLRKSSMKPDLSKTKICPFVKLHKTCPEREDCRFAHCIEELRSTSNFYKTVLCRAWKLHGYCRLEDYCRYAHGEDELRHPDDENNAKVVPRNNNDIPSEDFSSDFGPTSDIPFVPYYEPIFPFKNESEMDLLYYLNKVFGFTRLPTTEELASDVSCDVYID